MAFPVIIVDSATGSDSAASGAGPGDGTTSGSALTGTSASTSGDGLTVTLDGSPDLSGVATDGSHVIYLADTTAGARNFGKITATDNSAKTVTVANAFGTSLSGKSWAIGGKRASIGSTTSKKLFDQGSSTNADAMPGWTVEMKSGHTETTGSITGRKSGDFTDGRITLRGEEGAATMPVITFSNNGAGFYWANVTVNLWHFDNFEIRNSNATKTASVAITLSQSNSECCVSRVRIDHATDKFWKAITFGGAGATNGLEVRDCQIGNTASNGIEGSGYAGKNLIRNCRIKSAGGSGILLQGTSAGPVLIEDCVITGCTGDGINAVSSSATSSGFAPTIARCVIHGNTGDGINLMSSGNARVIRNLVIENNNITGNGGYGVNLNGQTAAAMAAAVIRNNNFGTGGTANTSGTVSTSGVEEGSLSVDPGYTNTGSDDYSGGTAIKAQGWPTGNVGVHSGTRTYLDIGMQRQESPDPRSLFKQSIGTY